MTTATSARPNPGTPPTDVDSPRSSVTRRTVLTAGALTGVALGANLPAPAQAVPDRTLVGAAPAAADALVDAFGVVTHFNFRDSEYGDHDLVIDWLAGLGVRHVRSRLAPARDVLSAFGALTQLGIKVNATCGTLRSSQDMDSLMQSVADGFGDPTAVFSGFEGINEPNNDGIPWVQKTREKTRALHAAREAYGLTDIPIIAPALARVMSGGIEGGDTAGQAEALGDLTDAIDYGNMHVYPRGLPPSSDLDYFTAAARQVCGDLPILCTEGGYFTAMGYKGGARPVPLEVAAAYAPQQILEHWNAGTRRFFRYELLDAPNVSDSDREGSLGMVNTGTLWSPKPDYVATRQLLRTFADPGPAFTPAPLTMSLDGGPSDLRHAVFAKRDGSYLVALWLDRPIWNPRQRSLAVPSLTTSLETVTLNLGSPRIVTTERLTDPGTASRTSPSSSFSVGLSAGVTVLTLT